MLKKLPCILALAALPLAPAAFAEVPAMFPANLSLTLQFEDEATEGDTTIESTTLTGQALIEFLFQDEENFDNFAFGLLLDYEYPLLVMYDTTAEFPVGYEVGLLHSYAEISLSNEQGEGTDLSFNELFIDGLAINYEQCVSSPNWGISEGLQNELYRYRRSEEGGRGDPVGVDGVLRARLTGLKGELFVADEIESYLLVNGTFDVILHENRIVLLDGVSCWEPPEPEV